MEVIHEAPSVTSLTPLSQHQSQTPESFYSATPILYYYSPSAKLIVLESELEGSPALSTLRTSPSSAASGAITNGDTTEQDHEIVIPDVDIWVTSDTFRLYVPSKNTGLSIPYPTISLHAIQRLILPSSNSLNTASEFSQGLFMQLTTSNGFDDHNPDDTVSLTLIPSPTSTRSSSTQQSSRTNLAENEDPTGGVEMTSETPIQALFSAVSACANLHPDPLSGSDAEPEIEDDIPSFDYQINDSVSDGLPPPMPGSGGWITADNMGEYFDEEGNWRGRGLGPSAGIVREREDDENSGNEEGNDGDGEERKWRRIE